MDRDSVRGWAFVRDTVLPRIGMYTGGETYERAVCFVIGFDQAIGGSLEPLLNQWARERFGETARSWPGVILDLACSPETPRPNDIDAAGPETDRAARLLLADAIRTVSGPRLTQQ